MDLLKMIDSICVRVNNDGGRVAIPATEQSPITAMFDGGFCNAEYIPTAGTVHFYGIGGNVTAAHVVHVEQVTANKYIMMCGDKENGGIVIVTINSDGGRA